MAEQPHGRRPTQGSIPGNGSKCVRRVSICGDAVPFRQSSPGEQSADNRSGNGSIPSAGTIFDNVLLRSRLEAVPAWSHKPKTCVRVAPPQPYVSGGIA